MAEAFKKLKSLRGRSLDELRVRGAQALAARAERRGLSRQARIPTDAEFLKLLDTEFLKTLDADSFKSLNAGSSNLADVLLEHFRRRASHNFFASFADTQATLAAWRRHTKHSQEKLIERAQRIAEGK
ncbi:MAG TPA: hypothetical protein VFX96_08315, partial [Pyrinomonadaceae bacterium]|nr:hypothetical protein [Pyrinomonadaceae bacterium]